jgi:dinuclear metal center YbgI/SA1388 family protein
MQIKEIYDYLDKISPFCTQEKWDNSGLIVGNMEDNFDQICISLDLDEELLSKIENNTLIITHHPLIFSAIKTMNDNSYSTKLLKTIIKKDLKLISLHTNIDKSHLNNYVMTEILGFDISYRDNFLLSAEVNMSFNEFQKHIKQKLNLKFNKSVKSHNHIKSFSLCTGSGMSLIHDIKTDCFLTGDIKYHDAMEAKIQNISLIDIGHWESEIHFTPMVKGLLKNYLELNQINVIMGENKNPFDYT